MSFRTWMKAWKSAAPKSPARRPQARRTCARPSPRQLYLEPLEERDVPTFLTPVSYDGGSTPQAMVAADFTNDGVQDLAVVNSDSTVSVLVGDALVPGTFKPAVTSPTGFAPLSVAVGDFNHDGNLDLATANANDVSVLLGDGLGSFAPAPGSGIGLGSSPQSVAVGDFNRDGLLDLGVTSNAYVPEHYDYWTGYWYPGYYEGYATVLLGDGAGGFSGTNSTFIDYASCNTALATDLNGDSHDDFVTFDSSGYVVVLPSDSSGYLQGPGYFYTGDYSYAVAAGDIDGDGDNDLVTANYSGKSVGVLLGDGSGGFSGPTNFAVGGYPTSIALGDFTHDGNLDVATTDYSSSQVSVLYGNGAGGFSTPVLSATGSYPWAVAAGDFNGDGWLDAATVNQDGQSVSVLINSQSWPDPPPPPPPLVSINDPSAVVEGNIGSVDVTFTLTLSFGYATPITVHYQTADGSASGGSDYTAASGDVTFAPFQTSYPITVKVLGDRLAEPTETFVVNLTTSDAQSGDVQGVGTILDDEPRISIGDVTVTEGNTSAVNAKFTLTLSAKSDVDVKVHFDTANGSATAGSDYTAVSGAEATIPAGQTSVDIMIAVTGDRVAEPTENFFVNLSAPTNAGISDGQGVGTILDNEPRISINNVRQKEGNGKSTLFVFTVSLSAAYDQAVTVNYATANGSATAGSDYQEKHGALTFAPGVRSMTISITVLPDKVREPDETFFVNLSGASNNALISVLQGMGTIVDDDQRGKA